MKKKGVVKDFVVDVLFDIMAAIIYSFSVNMFTAPNQIAPGGVTGLATILNYLFDFKIGITSFCINVPLIILGLVFLGRSFTLRTLKTVALFSLFVDLIGPHIVPYTKTPLLAALFGGILTGISLGLVFLRGSTTGGTDILGRLIQIPLPHVQIGKLVMASDGLILILSAIVYHSIETAMYGVIVIFIEGRVIDTILYGYDQGKQLMIFSDNNEEIGKRIMEELKRGATFFQAKGAYSMDERDVLMCIVKRNQFGKVKKIIKDIDPSAFVVVTDVGEVIGTGFKSIDKK